MKRLIVLLVLLTTPFACFAQSLSYRASAAASSSGVNESSLNAGYHLLTWAKTGTVSVCTVQLQSSTTGAAGTYGAMTNSPTSDCTTAGAFVVSDQVVAYTRITVLTFTGTAGSYIQFNYKATPSTAVLAKDDGYYFVTPDNCFMTPTTTAFTAGPALIRAAAGNVVLYGTINGTAGTVTVDCDMSPPTRLMAGRGVQVTGFGLLYGVQTANITSIAAASFNLVTYPLSTTAGVAAAGTVTQPSIATSVQTPTALQLTATTTGQCFNEYITFGTNFPFVTANTRLNMEQVFSLPITSTPTLQICGAYVTYKLPVL